MSELERELKEVLKQRAGLAPSPLPSERAVRAARHRRMLTAVATFAVVLVSTGAALAMRSDWSPEDRITPVEDSSPSPQESERNRDWTVIANGRKDGDPWALNATRNGDRLCMKVEWQRGNSVECFRSDAAKDVLSVSSDRTFTNGEASTRPIAVAGAVSPRVASISVVSDSGETLPLRLVSLSGWMDFYIGFVPFDTDGDLVARDASGDALVNRPLAIDEMHVSVIDGPRCGTSIRPHYLPWLGDSEVTTEAIASIVTEVPLVSQDSARTYLIWTNPNDEDEQVKLGLYRLQRDRIQGQRTSIKIFGQPGFLQRRKSGTSTIRWNLDWRCNLLELSYSNPHAGMKAVEDEVQQIAKSLRVVRVTLSGGTAGVPPSQRSHQGNE